MKQGKPKKMPKAPPPKKGKADAGRPSKKHAFGEGKGDKGYL